jgi:hypothetical protein
MAPPAEPAVPPLPAVALAPAALEPPFGMMMLPAEPGLPAPAEAPPLPPPLTAGSSEPEAQLSTRPMHTDSDSNPRNERYSMSTDYHPHHAAPAKPWSNSEIYYQDHKPTTRNDSMNPTRGE